jgi:ABC-type antimicrobial peptide transport system permease subunit
VTRWTLRVSPRDLVHEAADALLADRLRTALSAVGIVFGVATVITAFANGEGARRAALAEIGALGIDNVFVRAVVAPRRDGARQAAAPLLSLADVRAVSSALPPDTTVAALRAARVEATAAGRHAPATLAGVTSSWRRIAEVELSAGRWLTGDDDQSQRRVAIVGGRLARDLFGHVPAIGARVHAGGAWYAIVGVLRERSAMAPRPTVQGLDADRALLVPLGAMAVSLGGGDRPDRIQEIAVRAAGADDVEPKARSIARLLGRRHPGAPVFELVVPKELLRARLKTERTFTMVLVAIGLLALTISGVGVMNIMLANVAVRVGEIGVRRAFGARRGDILAQFTLEALAMCVAGGVAGLPLGALLSGMVAVAAGWPVSVSPTAAAAAVLMSAAVGLLAGVYPARIAAGIQPIDALRAL